MGDSLELAGNERWLRDMPGRVYDFRFGEKNGLPEFWYLVASASGDEREVAQLWQAFDREIVYFEKLAKRQRKAFGETAIRPLVELLPLRMGDRLVAGSSLVAYDAGTPMRVQREWNAMASVDVPRLHNIRPYVLQ